MNKGIFIILFIILVLGWTVQAIYLPVSTSGKTVEFRITPGQGVTEVASNLESRGLIKDELWFNLYTTVTRGTKQLKAGTYLLTESMNVPEILRKFKSGETFGDKLTVVEGWTIRDIAAALEEKGWMEAEQFFKVVGSPATDYSMAKKEKPDQFDQFDFLKEKPDRVGLEGYLFPDTYRFSDQVDARDIAVRMLRNFDRKFDPELRKKAEQRGKSVFEIITMASLLEKEVRTPEDKRIVSGILWKRLNHNIPLQVDATISYITGKNTTKISKEETQVDSPFNTYKYGGLPLGPICNPGLESIRAALNPASTDYWYYLSVPQERQCPECTSGRTVFSKTLRQHNIAKSKYLK